MQFGVSTHLYHGQRLAGTTCSRLRRTGSRRSRCSRRGRTSTTTTRRRWPTCSSGWPKARPAAARGARADREAYRGGRWGAAVLDRARGDASARAGRRKPSARCTSRGALPASAARRPAPRVPRTAQQPAARDSRTDAARRSIEELHAVAEPLGVRLAVEVIPNELSRAGSLVHSLEEELGPRAARASASTSGMRTSTATCSTPSRPSRRHLIATHVHDNGGRTDEHLVPFDGRHRLAGGADGACRRSATTARCSSRSRRAEPRRGDAANARARARAQRM